MIFPALLSGPANTMPADGVASRSSVCSPRFSLASPSVPVICIAAILFVCAASHSRAQSPSSFSSSFQQAQKFTPVLLDSGFGPLDTSLPTGIAPAEIIDRFAAKESQFKVALENYTYRRTVKFDTLDDTGHIDGEYLQVDDIVFSSLGHKREMVVYAPDNTLTRVAMSPADFDDIEQRLPFTLTTEDIGQYRIAYAGKQSIDQVATYVFDVAPKRVEKGSRYFLGRIWVDAHDFQIVVTNGKNIPDDTARDHEDLSVPFTTYRQRVDGKYWFPVYTRAEGILHFKNCKQCLPEDVHLKEIVRYGDYKRFGSDIRIIYDGLAEDEKAQPSPAPSASMDSQAANSRDAGNPLLHPELLAPQSVSSASPRK